MWLLPTRGRPAQCQDVLDTCEVMGMTAPGVVFIDGRTTPANDDAYHELDLPHNWIKVFSEDRVRLTASMQWAFNQFPNESSYGWLADDTFPQTPNFDAILEAAAGSWEYAQANDAIARNHQWAGQPRILTSGLCWGGELVRAVGWWGWPEVTHVGIDGMWARIIEKLGVCHYCPDVVVEHRHWSTGKRERDAIDVTSNDDDEVVKADMRRYKKLKKNDEVACIADRVRTLRQVAVDTDYRAAAHRAIFPLGQSEPFASLENGEVTLYGEHYEQCPPFSAPAPKRNPL